MTQLPPTSDALIPNPSSSQDEQETLSPLPVVRVSSPAPVPNTSAPAPSLDQLDEAVNSVLYLCRKHTEDPDSLSPSTLLHLYSLCTSTLAHVTSPAHVISLASAFLPLRCLSPDHTHIHAALLPTLLHALFTLSRSPSNDDLLLPLLPLLSAALCDPSTGLRELVDAEASALMVLFSLLYNVTSVEGGAAPLLALRVLDWLLAALDAHPTSVPIAVDVLALLRNLACAPAASALFASALPGRRQGDTVVDALCRAAVVWTSDAGVSLGVLRVLAKLSLHDGCRALMARHVDAVQALVGLLHAHGNRLALCIRVAFTLGNLTMANDDIRYVIADTLIPLPSPTPSPTTGLHAVLALLTRTVQRDAKLRVLLASPSPTPRHAALHRENADLLVKLVRLLANLAIHGDVGERLAGEERMEAVIPLVREGEGEEELAVNALSCLCNVSYFLQEDGAAFVGRPMAAVLDGLAPLLCSPQSPLLPQLLLLLANLTRHARAREALSALGGDEAVLLLLHHPSSAVLHAALGVLVNITGEDAGRRRLTSDEGEWVCALLDAGEGDSDDDDSDWSTVRGLVGKVVCNLRTAGGLRGVLAEDLMRTVAETFARWRTELENAEEDNGEAKVETSSGKVEARQKVELLLVFNAVCDACQQ